MRGTKRKVAVISWMTIAALSTTHLVSQMEVLANQIQETKSVTYTTTQKRNVMYYGDWSIWGGQGNFYPKDIPADQLTHLNFAFLDFDAQGNLIFTDKDAAIGAPVGQEGVQWDAANAGILNALQEVRAKNPNLRLGVSVGGWSKSADFPLVAANDATRQKFVDHLMKFIEYTNMDFVDIDWEFAGEVRQPDLVDNKNDEGNPYASSADKQLYITLLEDLRTGVDTLSAKLGKTIELSVALPAPKEKVDVGIDVNRLFELVDFANIMTYDMRGAWDNVSGHQTGLYPNVNEPIKGRHLSISESVDYLIEQGAEPEKIVVGAAYYTRGWNEVEQGPDAALPGLFGEASLSTKDADQTPSYGAINEAPLTAGDGGRMSGIWSYRNLDKLKSLYPGLTEYWDDEAKAPYLYDQTTGMFFTYDNVRSITEKATYVNENNLGGMIGWMQSQDAPTTSSKRDELTKATKEGLFGSSDLPHYEIVYADLDVSVSIESYEEAWGANPKGYIITVKNNEKVEETDAVLKAVERGAETIKAPKLYIKSEQALTSGDYTAGTVTYENGYTVVDFSKVWEGKTIEQGGTYTFKLKGDSEIESIHLTQRMSETGPEMYSQLIYGTDSEETEKPNTAPILLGLSNKTITLGDAFDPRAGVSANDKEDGDLTDTIEIVGEVDTNVVGEYELTYSVTDSKGLTTVSKRVIKVVEPVIEENTAPVLFGVEAKTIELNSNFNKTQGITANDKEDGDLTASIIVTGHVDTSVVGEYVLTYSVTDSEGLTTTKDRVITVVEAEIENPAPSADFGVGQGIEWPSQVNAPFIDMVSWITKPDYTNNGAPNLVKIAQDTDVLFYNLGFIQATGGITDGIINWGWGGHNVLSERSADNSQYVGIKKSIRELRELGGDVTISLGGLNGIAFWEVTQDVEVLTNTYRELVNGYGLTRLDLDIEGAAQNKAHNIENAKAIKAVQDETGVKIVLTLPVLPSGLTSVQLDVVEAYLSEGVDVEVVNVMTMCYGTGTLLPGENYGTASLRAIDSTKDQIQEYFKKYAGIELSDEEAYRKLGTTPSIGFEGSAHPIFTTEWATLVVEHAIERGLGMTSFWSMNRDAMLETNSGVSSQYEFTNIFKSFGTETAPSKNTAPVLKGVTNKTLTVGDSFDALEGVIATDKEDGDLTALINVSGVVNTQVAGEYVLTYSVTDSEGLETTATRVVTVKEKENNAPVINGVKDQSITLGEAFDALEGVTAFDEEDGDLTSAIIVKGAVDTNVAGRYTLTYSVTDSQGKTTSVEAVMTVKDPNADTFDMNKIYLGGDTVIFNGDTYTAKWWVQGEYPNESAAWEKEIKPNEDGSISYESGMVFNGGEIVSYNGKLYKAKWWTNTTPGSDSSWELVSDGDDSGNTQTPNYEAGTPYTQGQLVLYKGQTYEAKWWTTSTPGTDEAWKLIG